MTTLVLHAGNAVTKAIRAKVLALEAVMREMPQAHVPIRHGFAKGLYIRIADIPKGVTLTGKIHRTEHVCVLSKGEVSVATQSGVRRLKAPCMVLSPPGEKRAIYAHEPSVWANLHRTIETDLERIEAQLIAPTFEDLDSHSERKAG